MCKKLTEEQEKIEILKFLLLRTNYTFEDLKNCSLDELRHIIKLYQESQLVFKKFMENKLKIFHDKKHDMNEKDRIIMYLVNKNYVIDNLIDLNDEELYRLYDSVKAKEGSSIENISFKGLNEMMIINLTKLGFEQERFRMMRPDELKKIYDMYKKYL